MAQGSGRPGGHPGSNNSTIPELFGSDPSVTGLDRPVGWRVQLPDGSAAWDKFGPNSTDWIPVGGTAAAVASWPLANPRIFAVDFVNGIDTNKGFADATSSSPAAVAAATVAAGAVARKTIAGLASIFPANGANRLAVIVIRANTYTDNLSLVLGAVQGYASGCPIVRGTDTNATAGCTAFDGSAADLIYMGGTTAPGLNAAGYNPTGAPTTKSIPLLKVGGGAAGLPAEPGQPLGLRLRFDAATTTVALRNACVAIVGTAGDTILTPGSNPLPAVPVASDVCYIEAPGVVLPIGTMASGNNSTVALGPQLLGLRTTAGASQLIGYWSPQFAWLHQLTNTRPAASNISNLFGLYQYVDGTFPFVGATIRVDSVPQFDLNDSTLEFSSGAIIGTTANPIIARDCNAFEIDDGAVISPQLIVGNMRPTVAFANYTLGASVAAGQVTSRIIGVAGSQTGPGLKMTSFYGRLGNIALTQMGAQPAIQPVGTCLIVMGSEVTGSTGNTDVGLDLTQCQGCTIILLSLPTVSGGAGNVRLSNGTIITWATANAGVTDTNGNEIYGTGNAPGHPIAVANGVVAVTINNAPTGSGAAPTRYVKFPDGAGGFYTFPSLS